MNAHIKRLAVIALLSVTAGSFSLASQAAGNPPKPKCPMGQLPVLEQGAWHCEEAKIKAKGSDEELKTSVQGPYQMKASGAAQAAPAAGPAPKCPKGQLPKLENGVWMCKDMSITAPTPEQRSGYMKFDDIKGESTGQAAPSAGPAPKCPKGQIPKLENGHWKCSEMAIKAKGEAQRAVPQQRPKCPQGQVAKMENGGWVCAELNLKAPGTEEARAAAKERPKCPKGQLPKMENGDWVCRSPGYQANPGQQE